MFKKRRIKLTCAECGVSWTEIVLSEEELEDIQRKIDDDCVLCEEHKPDPHLGCPAYPCCDLNPTGCSHSNYPDEEMDWFGHRD